MDGILTSGLRDLGATRMHIHDGQMGVDGPQPVQNAFRAAQAMLRARARGLAAGALARNKRPAASGGGSAMVHRTTLGALTSGLAHELNNPLAAVIANLDLATRQVEERLRATSTYTWLDDLNAELQDARDAANQVHRIVRRLRPLGLRTPGREDCDLAHSLEVALSLLGRELRRRGRIRRAAPAQGPVQVLPSSHHTTHAVMGLLSHVLHVLPATADKREIGLYIEMRSRSAVQLRISARPGIPEDLDEAARVSRRLVEELAAESGAKLVDGPSDADEWSCALEIPLRNEATPSPLPPRRQAAERVGRVLVIDDEPLIGKLVSRILSTHDVVLVHDGTTGLARAHREAWDLILVDMNLPDLRGDVVADELTALDPVKAEAVVRMSGGLMDHRPGDRPVLKKPFDPNTLRALLKHRLEQA